MVLSLESVGVRYAGARSELAAVDGVTLGLGAGQIGVLIGPSGCGKTTLLRAVAGLEPLHAGRVRMAGQLLSDADSGTQVPPEKRRIGMVFQDYALFPHLSVADNVAFGVQDLPRTERAARVARMLDLVGLAHAARRLPHQLSGGQQQRIALARALATSPGLLLLDEPLSALDALERVRLRSEIRALQAKLSVTTIMVTHDQEEALAVADRIVVMNHGVIEQVGTPLQIYREPASPFVADFVGKVNVLPGRVAAGRLHAGALQFDAGGADRDVRIYLRPEDVLARPIADGDPHVFDATIEKIEFLGSYCHVHVASPAFAAQPLTVYLSLNYLAEQSLQVGSALRLRLLQDRLKVF